MEMMDLSSSTVETEQFLENANSSSGGSFFFDASEDRLEQIRRQTIVVVQMILFPIVVCFGCLGNAVTIIVLTRPWMKSSTNYYLSVLAVYDILYLVFGLSMSFKHYASIGRQPIYTVYRAYVGRPLTDTWSNTGIWLTVTFTVERYIVVCHPMRGKVWCTTKRAKMILAIVCLAAAIVTFPEFFERRIVWDWDPIRNVSVPRTEETEFGRSPGYTFGYQYLNQALFTFLPLVLLSTFNTFLIRALVTAAKNRSAMTSKSDSSQGTRDQQRITLMLICVVIVFLFCQLPSALALLYLNFVKNTASSHQLISLKIVNNVCNLLVMINSSVNFVLYSSFSTKFRNTFRRLFLGCLGGGEAGAERGPKSGGSSSSAAHAQQTKRQESGGSANVRYTAVNG